MYGIWKYGILLVTLLSFINCKDKGKDDVGIVIGIDLGTTYSW